MPRRVEEMDERKPQPAWKKQDEQTYHSGNRNQRRNNDNRDNRKKEPLPEQKAPNVGPLEVEVYNNDVGQALKVLKMKIAKDGIMAELRKRKHAEKPSEKKRRKHREALKRMRKSKGKSRRTGNWKGGKERSKAEIMPKQENITNQAPQDGAE